MIRNLTRLAATLALLIPAAGMVAATRYVSPTGTGDGSSWENAMSDLQEALDASENGDQIWVAAGTYHPTKLIKSNKASSKAFMLKDGVSLYGGFAGTETSLEERAIGSAAYEMANATILSADDDVPDNWVRVIADATTYRWEWELTSNQVTGTKGNSSHVLYYSSTLANPTIVDGFTLTGANANVATAKPSGGAVYAQGPIEIRNCRILENSAYFTAEATDCNSYGGAVYLSGGTMKDCYIARTYCHSSYGNGLGGAVYAKNSTISGCVFEDCVGLDGGGAVYLYSGSLDNCTFARCYATNGGAIYNNGGTVTDIEITDCRGLIGGGIFNNGTVHNAIVRGCYADATEYSDGGNMGGGAIYNYAGTLSGILAYNNTSYNGGGVYLRSGKLINATVQNNTIRMTEGGANVAGATTDAVLNSITATDVNPSNFIAPTTFTGCATDDMQLALLYSADWRPAPGSEFIDAGTPVEGYTDGTDLAGNPRVFGNAIDLGAYEAQNAKKIPAIILTFAPGTEAARIGTGGATGYEFTIDWGDGEEVSYNEQGYYTSLLKGSTVKIYGDDVILLYANSQNITTADFSRATKLQRIQLQANGLMSLVLSEHPNLDGIYAAGNKLSSIDISKCPSIKVLDLYQNELEGSLDCSHLSRASKIDVSDNKLTSLTLPKTTTLYEVDCSNNLLTSLDATGLSGLSDLKCAENAITELDLSGLSAMESLYATVNKLSAIDLTPCTSLETLNVSENEIKAIDLAPAKALSGVYLQDNKLDAIDITSNPSIRWFNIGNNNIETLDVSAQKQLSILIASNNRLSEIDLSNNSSLSSLDLAGNRLKSINVSNIPYLSQFHIENNEIESIDLSKNAYLYGFFCANNGLTSLDITNNKYLQRLEAQGNAISSLDITQNTGLQEILLQSNKLNAEALQSLVAALPDVNNVTVTPETEDFIRQLNVSFMPGTAATDFTAATAKGWFVTSKADLPGEITLDALNIQINRVDGAFSETWNTTIEFTNDDHTAIRFADFMGTGSSINAVIDTEGNIKIYPQVCGMDDNYNFLMIVNAQATTGNPMAISDTYVSGRFTGTSLVLDAWNLIIVPYTFAENLGTFFSNDITSEFVAANGTMDISTGDNTVSRNIYAEVTEDENVVVYGWGECAMATLSKINGKWCVDKEATAYAGNGNDYMLTNGEGETLEAANQPDARTLVFGDWKLSDASNSIIASATASTVNFGFDLPQGSTSVNGLGSAEIISVRYYNAAGAVSSEPFDGFNIKVEKMSDGNTRTTKMIYNR